MRTSKITEQYEQGTGFNKPKGRNFSESEDEEDKAIDSIQHYDQIQSIRISDEEFESDSELEDNPPKSSNRSEFLAQLQDPKVDLQEVLMSLRIK